MLKNNIGGILLLLYFYRYLLRSYYLFNFFVLILAVLYYFLCFIATFSANCLFLLLAEDRQRRHNRSHATFRRGRPSIRDRRGIEPGSLTLESPRRRKTPPPWTRRGLQTSSLSYRQSFQNGKDFWYINPKALLLQYIIVAGLLKRVANQVLCPSSKWSTNLWGKLKNNNLQYGAEVTPLQFSFALQ